MSIPVPIPMSSPSSATMGAGGEPTGHWFEELTAPFFAFTGAGAVATLASIAGEPAPIDHRSLKPRGRTEASVERFRDDAAASAGLAATILLSEVAGGDFDAVVLPGGHGISWDLPRSEALADFPATAWGAGKVVSAVCYGPAGLVRVTDETGAALVRNRRVTAFSDSEERAAGLADRVPFLLERRLPTFGAPDKRAADFRPCAVANGRLVNGQNPASSDLTTQPTIDALAEAGR